MKFVILLLISGLTLAQVAPQLRERKALGRASGRCTNGW